MEKLKGLTEKQNKLFRYYRHVTIWILSFSLGLSIWAIMINNLEWTLNDILYPVLSLIVIILAGMFANANNNFSLFHLRGIRITKERLISILMGLFFPVVFLIYIMVTDDSFMDYVSNISLHNFITLSVYSIPVFLFITLVMYFGYLVVAPKTKRKNVPQYKEEIEISLDEHKKMAINIVLLLTGISLWVKVGLNDSWSIYKILVELIVLAVIFVIRIVANKDNKLPWNYNESKLLNSYFFLIVLTPYILVLLYFIISKNFRLIAMSLGYKTIVSILVYLLPAFILCALAILVLIDAREKSKENSKKEIRITKKMAKRNENILLALILTAIFVLLFFIYVVTRILETLTLEILLQIWTILIPLSVIIYIVIYYSIKDINR